MHISDKAAETLLSDLRQERLYYICREPSRVPLGERMISVAEKDLDGKISTKDLISLKVSYSAAEVLLKLLKTTFEEGRKKSQG